MTGCTGELEKTGWRVSMLRARLTCLPMHISDGGPAPHIVGTKITKSTFIGQLSVPLVFYPQGLKAVSASMRSVPMVRIWDAGYEVTKHECAG